MVLSKIILHLLGDLRFCVTCSILANFYVLLCYPERVIGRPIYLQYMQLFRIDALYICNLSTNRNTSMVLHDIFAIFTHLVPIDNIPPVANIFGTTILIL